MDDETATNSYFTLTSSLPVVIILRNGPERNGPERNGMVPLHYSAERNHNYACTHT